MGMVKSSILVRTLDTAQLSLALSKSVNTVLSTTPYLDVIVYYENWGRLPEPPRFGMMIEREFVGSEGVCIATDINTAGKLIRCPGNLKKYFYVWNLEWLNSGNLNYEFLHNIYCNPDISLIAKSDYHANLLTRVWKKPEFIMSDFDPAILKQVLYDSQI